MQNALPEGHTPPTTYRVWDDTVHHDPFKFRDFPTEPQAREYLSRSGWMIDALPGQTPQQPAPTKAQPRPRPVLVPTSVPQDATRRLWCDFCAGPSQHRPVTVMYYSPAGARRLRFWECSDHPLPDPLSEP